MRVSLITGPAGVGKTHRCVAWARAACMASAEGPALIFVAPKQTTYLLERRILHDGEPGGYARLQILSFERLAHYVLQQLNRPLPGLLDQEGRVMVLRRLLVRRSQELKLFRASARLTGFAQQLSEVLGEFQRRQLDSRRLRELLERLRPSSSLSLKLEDLATLTADYETWLKEHQLRDAGALVEIACQALLESQTLAGVSDPRKGKYSMTIDEMWIDGFTEFDAPELELLGALMPYCRRATATFCLPSLPAANTTSLSSWTVAARTFENFQERVAHIPGAEIEVLQLEDGPSVSRFESQSPLTHLERSWGKVSPKRQSAGATLRIVRCAQPEDEARLAAREILRFARGGGRYREVAVLMRNLENYEAPLTRVFKRYGIPFFLDRRQSVAHHPAAELSRSAFRTVVLGWLHEDWFAALKTGLIPAESSAVDELENEALARGWRGQTWHEPIQLSHDDPGAPPNLALRELEARLEKLRRRLVAPFDALSGALGLGRGGPPKPVSGSLLASAFRSFWQTLELEAQLQSWSKLDADEHFPVESGATHQSVWHRLNEWLDNLERAFGTEAMALRDWLPILEAGLGQLSVGIIPPAVDQVLVGAIDRSRHAEVELGVVLGWNEGQFPAPHGSLVLLTDSDRDEIQNAGVRLGVSVREHQARESYQAYLACTRARKKLLFTFSRADEEGVVLNPSPYLEEIRSRFTDLEIEDAPTQYGWQESEHVVELVPKWLQLQSSISRSGGMPSPWQERFGNLPVLREMQRKLELLRDPDPSEFLSPEIPNRLYGQVLQTSVSGLEQFAACPFKFFVHSGLKAEERQLFELDARAEGNFQHEVLAAFHFRATRNGGRWRDLTPEKGSELIAEIAREWTSSFNGGLLLASEESQFRAKLLTSALQAFIATAIEWNREQYDFDPVSVELPFGDDRTLSGRVFELPVGNRLLLRGRIDRIDFHRHPNGSAYGVVVDYKSSDRKLDRILLDNGLQLQLPAYLSVLRAWPDCAETFGVSSVRPVGVFYVNLRGRYQSAANRDEANLDSAAARKKAYQHRGYFDEVALPQLDTRPKAKVGDQFAYALNQNGTLRKRGTDGLATSEFIEILDDVDSQMRQMGTQIFAGNVKVDPYRRGTEVACDRCEYAAICRIDRWSHPFRVLKARTGAGGGGASDTEE